MLADLDEQVGVHEIESYALGQQHTDRAFARSGHSDESDGFMMHTAV